jgi:DNA-binding transcriptional MerR regulator
MFKIGEFSTIARVSDVLLRHYDDIDLLKPSYVDPENGYRYYSIEQLPQLNRILALRDLGLALDQIGSLISDDISSEEIQGMLKLREAQIEQSIKDERSRLRQVKARLKQIRQSGTLSEHDVVVKAIPEQPFLSLKTRIPSLMNSGHYYYEITDAVMAHQVKGLSYCVAVFHEPAFRVENVAWELGFLLNAPFSGTLPLPDGNEMCGRTLPAVEQMATVVHMGPWSEMHLGFGALGAWMEVNGFAIAGPAREVYLNLVPPGQDDKFVVEIQMPVVQVVT